MPTLDQVNPQSRKQQSDAMAISIAFVVLCFLLSTPFWYILAGRAFAGAPTRYLIALMWCPALAAVIVRLVYRRSLKGFGFQMGKARWLILAVMLPAIGGLVLYASAWISGVAPIDHSHDSKLFTLSFIPFFFAGLAFSCFAALGEELGWRGLLVPELSRHMNYTKLSFVSGIIWTVWHFPLILFSTRQDTTPLWVMLVFFSLWVTASSFVHAWMRLVSESIWVSMLLHGSANYFISVLYPTITMRTAKGESMLGEYGWGTPLLSGVIAIAFWTLRGRVCLPTRRLSPV